MKRKSISILLAACMVLTCFTGCAGESRENVDYNLDDSTQRGRETESENQSTLAQFSNLGSWEEKFTVDYQGQERPVQIEAEIEIPETDHMSVVEVKVPDVGEEDFDFMEKMAFPVEKEVQTEEDMVIGADPTVKQLMIRIYPKDFTEAIPEGINRDEDTNYTYFSGLEDSGENLCKYSREEAEELSKEFLVEAGYLGYEPVETCELNWTGDYVAEDEYSGYYNQRAFDGYVVRFSLKDDTGNELSTSETNYSDFLGLSTGMMYSMRSRIDVYVVDEGIMQIDFSDPVQVVGSSSVVSLLSFESVQNIVRAEFQENFEEIYIQNSKFGGNESTVLFNSIELTYFRIRDKEKEGYYSYVPVWLFCRRMKVGGEEEEMIYSPVIINAIDGTVIDLREEF